MSKKTNSKLTDTGLQETKESDVDKLSDEELDNVDAGKGEALRCPKCGSTDLFWNWSCGFWCCSKCTNVWT